jgi:hypothetical protein
MWASGSRTSGSRTSGAAWHTFPVPRYIYSLSGDVGIIWKQNIWCGMTYISGATLQIGSSILEVVSQGVFYYMDGVAAAASFLPNALVGFHDIHFRCHAPDWFIYS